MAMTTTTDQASLDRRPWMKVVVTAVAAVILTLTGVIVAKAEPDIVEYALDQVDVNGGLPSVDSIDLNSATLERVVNAVEAFTGADINPIGLNVPGIDALGPISIPAAHLTIDYVAFSAEFEGSVALLTGDGDAKTVAFVVKATWDDLAIDEVPTIDVAVDGTAAAFDVADVLYLADGLVPGAAATAEELTTSLGVADFKLAFHWDNPATGSPVRSWLDITGTVVIAPADPVQLGNGIEFGFLFSRDSREGGEPVTVYGFKTRSTDPAADRITLSGLFDGPFGSVAGDLDLPETTLATVRGLAPDATLKQSDLRLGIPQSFFLDCGPSCVRGLPSDFEIDATLTVLARLQLASLGSAAQETFGFADDDTVDLYGKLGFTLSSFANATPVNVDLVKLRATIPSPVNSILPDYFQTGDWTFGVEYIDADNTIETYASTNLLADLPDATQPGGSVTVDFATKVTMITNTADSSIDLTLEATSDSDWVAPYGVDWITLDSVGMTGGTLTDTQSTAWDIMFTSAFELCAERSGSTCVSGIDALLEAQVGGEGDDVAASFRIGLGDDATDSVPIAALFDAIASEYGEVPDLGSVANAFILDQFSVAARVDNDGNVLFESRATVSLDFCEATRNQDGTCGVDLDLGTGTFYFFVEKEAGGGLVFFLGARPDLENISLADIVAAPGLEDMTLPGIGLILTTADITRESYLLTQDGYEFFRPLYGVAPEIAQGDTGSDFTVELEPGVNLVANLSIADAPEPVIELFRNLWIDVTRGIQFKGAITLPGLDIPNAGALSLEMLLPRVLPPREVDFIEQGTLRLGLRVDPKDLKVKLFVLGALDTRFRVDGVEVTQGSSCDVGTVELSFKRVPENAPPGEGTIEDAYYCYHRLRFEIETAVSLSPDGLEVTLTGSLIGQDGGWESPFGIDWLTLKQATIQFGIRVSPPTCQPCFSFGFMGNIVIGDNANPNESTEILIAADVGIKVLPPSPPFGQPTPVPEFNGFRGYFSRLGMSDIARLQAMIAGSAAPIDFSSLPDLEVRGGEIMIGLRDNEALCIQQGVGIAGELWINPDPDAESTAPHVPDGDCVPFGGFTDPVQCAARKDEGCFASVEMLLSLTGIEASGALVGFDLGPIHWDDAVVELRLTLAEQLLAASGGVSIDGLASGELAFRINGGLAPKVDFYGRGAAFDEFLVILDGSLGIDLTTLNLDDLEVFSLHAVLQSDFDALMRSKIEPELRSLRQTIGDIESVWATLTADPFEQIIGLPTTLQGLGVTPAPWVGELADSAQTIKDALATVGATSLPDLSLLITGGEFVTTVPKTACGFGQYYSASTDSCLWLSGDHAGAPGCPFGTTAVAATCEFRLPILSLVDLVRLIDPTFEAPPSLVAALDEVQEWLEGAVEAAMGFSSNASLDEYFDLIVDGLSGPSLVSVSCAEFDFVGGTDSTVSVRLEMSLLGSPYGFLLDVDLEDPIAAALSIFDSLLQQYVTGTPAASTCTGAVDPPFNSQSATPPLTVDLNLSTPAVDENSPVDASLTFNRAPGSDVTIDWGDGIVAPVDTAGGTTVTLRHTYPDDNPTNTSADVYVVTVRVAGSAATDTATVTVRNVAPTATILETPDVNETGTGTLRVEITDPGPADTFTAYIEWGDGATETRQVGRMFTVDHSYADDNPTETPVDTPLIKVRVSDDDTGQTMTTATATVRNVAPTIPDSTVAAVQAVVVNEGQPATFTIDFADVGTLDQHLVEVDWADQSQPGRATLDGERAATLTHTYADDDPTATNGDDYAVTISVSDDDLGTVVRNATVFVANVAPVVSLPDATSIEVQYSDPIGDGSSFRVTATDVTPDVLTASTTWRRSGDASQAAIPGWLQLSAAGCSDLGDGYSTCTWSLSPVVDPVSGIHTDVAPGTYELAVTIADDDGGSASQVLTIEVLPEDARIWYDGPQFAATASARNGTATLELRATLRDISSLPDDPAWDPWPGDVRQANVTFTDRDGGVLCADETVDLVFPGDVSIAVASCDWNVELGKNDDAVVVTVGSVVGGRYTRDHGDDDVVVTVARPLDDFVTGGGHLVLSDSAGIYAGDEGSKANFGMAVKFNKKGTNLQGRVTIIVRNNGQVYQIRSNALDSLGVDGNSAEFEAKANLTDVTDPDAPDTVTGNLTLQMTMQDLDDSGGTDMIGFSLWDIKKSGTRFLLFSSNWDGNQTQRQMLSGGNLVVHGL